MEQEFGLRSSHRVYFMSSVLLLTWGGHLHFRDVNQILVWVDVSCRVHVVSLVTLKDLRVVHVPCSLVGDEPQFVAIFLNCAPDGSQPNPLVRLRLSFRLIRNLLRDSYDHA